MDFTIHLSLVIDSWESTCGQKGQKSTGGIYKSTPHRVVNSSGQERLSIVLAFDPDPETLINPGEIPEIENNINEDPITCGDYLIWRFNRAFSYRKN